MNADTEMYIHREYPGAFSDVQTIMRRFGVFNPALALDLAGYMTGCVTVDGHERTGRKT